ncbi:unnamed protein product, partial [Pylaiella littoralis]
MPSTCHRHFAPSSQDGANVTGVPTRRLVSTASEVSGQDFVPTAGALLLTNDSTKRSTPLTLTSMERRPVPRRGVVMESSQQDPNEVSRQKIKQDRFDQLVPPTPATHGVDNTPSEWNERIVLAKN